MRSWLTPDRGEPAVFAAEVKAVCDLYAAAPALHARGVRLVGTDEKTGIQALEPCHPTLPTRPGLVERREAEYVRHGTQCLIANFEIATGHIVAPTVGPTRTASDFAAHIARTVATAPQAEWVFVVDQLNTHQSEALVEVVADLCALTPERDARGCLVGLRAMAARRTFLADPRHRVRFVYTPVHTSWLNQVELWFSILSRRLLKRGRFTSTEDLRQQLLAFVAYFNRTLARPFRWTYTGRPLTT